MISADMMLARPAMPLIGSTSRCCLWCSQITVCETWLVDGRDAIKNRVRVVEDKSRGNEQQEGNLL